MVSFVIIEFYSVDDARLCAESIAVAMGDQEEYEVIISSNSGYAPAQRQAAERCTPGARWLYNPCNGGFAYAMNRGMRAATGDLIVLLNPDVRMQYGLREMLAFARANPEVGAVAPAVESLQGELQDSARPYVSLPRYVVRTVKRVLGHRRAIMNPQMDYTLVQTVDWVIGACMVASRRAVELTGGMDEAYFMYAEDLDWCLRMRAAGLEVVYFPRAKVVYEGSRTARRSLSYARIFLRSHLIFWRKYGYRDRYPRRKHITWE